MNNQASVKNHSFQVVQKARYIVLVPFVAWLVFSIWIIVETAFPRFEIQAAKNPPSNSGLWDAGYWGVMALALLIDMIRKKIQNGSVSVEQKSLLPALCGGLLLGVVQYFQLNNYVFYFAIALIDVLPAVTIIVLLQGRSFGILRLYHRDVVIR